MDVVDHASALLESVKPPGVQLVVVEASLPGITLHDELSDKLIPVVGAVDKKTQRVALKLEGNDSIIVETGLYNLTNDEVPVLVHFGPDRQEARTLIRLKPPADQERQAAGQGPQ